MKELDNFESFIRESVEAHEVPFDASSWEAMDQKLTKQARVHTVKKWSWIGAAAVGTGVLIASIYHFNQDTSPQTQDTPPTTIVENTPEQTPATIHRSEPVSADEQPVVATPPKANDEAPVQNHDGATPNEVQQPATPTDNDPKVADQTPKHTPATSQGSDPQVANETEPHQTGTSAPLPSAAFTFDRNTVCAGEALAFKVESPQKDVTYQWDAGFGDLQIGNAAQFSFEKAGTFDVYLTAINADGTSVAEKATIKVNANPTTDFNVVTDEKSRLPMRTFEANNRSLTEFQWDFGQGITSTERAPQHYFERTGKYPVTLTVTNSNGCSGTTTEMVEVPHTVNPLAATGMNTQSADPRVNTFIPMIVVDGEYPFTLTIIDNRTKKVVFVSRDANNRWDGRDLEGHVKRNHAYVWKMELTNKHGQKEFFTGTIITE